SGASPRWPRQISAARAIQGPGSWSADSKVTIRIERVPSPEPEISASSWSSSRQLAGHRPDWAISRAARQASSNDAKVTDAEARKRGLSWRRIHARVMTPSMPSEPMKNRSAETPAPSPRRLHHTPRRDQPETLDELVDVRVQRREVAARAGGDPAAERRHLEGLREVPEGEPVRAQLVLQGRAQGTGLDQGGPGRAVDLE